MSIGGGGLTGPTAVQKGQASVAIGLAIEQPSIALQFAGSGALDPRVTDTRASLATYINSAGLVRYCVHNLFTYSEQFDNGAYAPTRANVTPNATTPPGICARADKLYLDATAGASHFTYSTAASFNAGVQAVIKLRAKAAELRYVYLAWGYNSAGCCYDLQGGVVSSTNWGTGSIASLGSGWYELTWIATPGSSGQVLIGLSNDGSVFPSFNGDGVSGVYIAGLQGNVVYSDIPYVVTTSAAYYGPRFDYDPATLAPLGLLVEESRTNLALWSEAFDSGAWFAISGATITANSAVSPDGNSTADTLVSVNSTYGGMIRGAATLTAAAYTFSLFVKKANWSYLGLRLDTSNSGDTYPMINLDTGVCTDSGVAGVTIRSTAYANGWYRVALTFTCAAGVGKIVDIGLCSATGSVFATVGAGQTAYIWGAQVELGSSPSSYIPTTSATVTRAADVVSMATAGWFNAAEGTLIATGTWPSVLAGLTNTLCDLNDGTAANCLTLYQAASSEVALSRVGAANQVILSPGTAVASGSARAAFAYKVGSYASSFEGAAAQTSSYGGALPVVNALTIGYSPISGWLNGTVKSILYYPKRLPDAVLQAMTA